MKKIKEKKLKHYIQQFKQAAHRNNSLGLCFRFCAVLKLPQLSFPRSGAHRYTQVCSRQDVGRNTHRAQVSPPGDSQGGRFRHSQASGFRKCRSCAKARTDLLVPCGYSGLHRDVYNDERRSVGTMSLYSLWTL